MTTHLMDSNKKPPDNSQGGRTVLSFMEEIKEDSAEDNQIVMYVLVNHDLKMGKGKIASQTAHSVCEMTRILEQATIVDRLDYYYKRWLRSGHATVVLKATQQEIDVLIEKYVLDNDTNFGANWCVHTRDQGRTQIAPNSLTTVAFRPMMKKFIPEAITKLKLL
jgi:PTH2 family peptidyl-tRNA hydrolase